MKQTIQKLLNNETLVATLLFLLISVISYGIVIPALGYYHDDWYLLWSGQARGADSIIPLFSTDRPFMGVVYSYVYRLLGDSIPGWHLYALLWRFIGAVAFFWILRLLWPNQKYITAMMVVLFLVYPGFLSIPNANTKQNHLYGFGTALLSIALTLQAMKIKDRVWQVVLTLVSLVLTANYLFIYEYMIGFEGTRIVLMGYVLFQDGVRSIRTLAGAIVKRVWPYLLVTAGFIYWRIFVFDSTRRATDAGRLAENYLGDFRNMSLRLILETVKDFIDTTLFAWFVLPYQYIASARYANLGNAVFIAAIVIGLVLLYSVLYKRSWAESQSENDSILIRDLIRVGALVTLCAILPVIFSGRQVDLFDSYKSYGLHPIPGVVLFVAGVVLMLQPPFRKWLLFVLIGISVTTQLLNAYDWQNYWTYQREMWWQLTWRAPDIQDGTVIMTYSSGGYNPQQDYEVWGPVNLIYRPYPAEAPPIQAEVLNTDTSYSVFKGETVDMFARDIPLHKDFHDMLLLTVSPRSSCLHVIDGTLPVYSESDALLAKQVGEYSRIDQIVTSGTAPVPPAAIFGTEPEHDWCYYYQKASLARQTGDWQEIKRLYKQTKKLGLNTDDKSELIPFLEALVNLGDHEEARMLYKQVRGNARLRLPLCNALAQDPGYPPEFGYNYEKINQILCEE